MSITGALTVCAEITDLRMENREHVRASVCTEHMAQLAKCAPYLNINCRFIGVSHQIEL